MTSKMNGEELKLILEEGENQTMEFKENIEGVDREIVAFSNAHGGRILLGVSDSGVIKGINITNRRKSQIQDIANNCQPRVNILIEEFDKIIQFFPQFPLLSESYYWMGWSYFKLADYKKAGEYFNQVEEDEENLDSKY